MHCLADLFKIRSFFYAATLVTKMQFFDPLGPSGYCMYHSASWPQNVFASFVWFSQQIGSVSPNRINRLAFVIGDELCFLWGMNWVSIYYLEEIQSLRIKRKLPFVEVSLLSSWQKEYSKTEDFDMHLQTASAKTRPFCFVRRKT